MRFYLATSVIVLAACSGKKGQQEAEPAAAPAEPAAEEAAASSTDLPAFEEPKRERPKPLGDAQKKALRAFMRQGRALQKDKKWAEATEVYERAVALAPGSARAFSELSWSAFQAGDHARAREAAELSVKLAVDPKLKAASLYNAGRAAEAQGEAEAAADLYRRSLELRPHKAVRKRLDALGSTPATAASDDDSSDEETRCREPLPGDDLCVCLEHPRGSCGSIDSKKLRSTPFDILVSADGDEEENTYYASYYLVEKKKDRYLLLGELASTEGERYMEEDFGFERLVDSKVGGRRVVQVVWRVSRGDLGHFDITEDMTYTTARFCVEDDTTWKCSEDLLIGSWHTVEFTDPDDADEDMREDAKREHGAALPIDEGYLYEVSVAEDGKVSAKLAKGKPNAEAERALQGKSIF
jgi:tetratricopeptide (TPR) repeat protein